MIHYLKMKNIISYLLFLACLAACDSGDIYPTTTTTDGVDVSASFTLSGLDAFPQTYKLSLAAFGTDDDFPLVSSNIPKPSNGNVVTTALENLPAETQTVKLCISTTGRTPICILYSQDVSSARNNKMNISENINLASFKRVQEEIFSRLCVSCHGSGQGAGKLLLTPSASYGQLVNTTANFDPTKKRVTANNIDESFIIPVLTDGSIALRQPHTTLADPDDITLLKTWINSGALKN